MSIFTVFVPGILLALLLGYWERRLEMKGVSPYVPHYSLNQIMIALLFAVMFIPLIFYLALAFGLVADDIATMSFASIMALHILARPVKWLMGRLVIA